jgi:murein DD-endopeptidase MepM/ murein hydrolase activator NlpD
MKRMFYSLMGILSFTIVGSIWHPVHTLANDPAYAWPLPKIRGLSSAFAEYRHFRFHSGIDIPTQGKTGYQVVACESGYVYRVFSSWNGYGKAVYLKLDDGRYAVYGHLSQFSENITRLVQKEQLSKERYYTDLFLKEGEIRVKRGELIGYSGESG